jgi:acetylornithine deacetylase
VDLFELTRSLIDIPSITGGEGPLTDFLSGYLTDAGFRVRTREVGPRRSNLLALLDEPPVCLLCTHLDTVPPWFGAREDGGHIYGRGACDAKGIMAAMIAAAVGLRAEGRRDCGLLFLAGEETDSIGARKADSLNPGSRFIVVGEPTRNKLGSAHKGVLTVVLKAAGRAVHSAYPERGESAVLKILDVLEDLRSLHFGPPDETLGPTLMNIGRVEGGVAPNVVPEEARAVVSFRTGKSPGLVLSQVEGAAAGRVDISVIAKSEPQVLFTVPGIAREIMPFGTDIPYLASFGRPLLLGPGSVLDAHTEHEKVEKAQLEEAVVLYQSIVRTLAEA